MGVGRDVGLSCPAACSRAAYQPLRYAQYLPGSGHRRVPSLSVGILQSQEFAPSETLKLRLLQEA